LSPTQHRIKSIIIKKIREPEWAINELMHGNIDLLPTVRLKDLGRFVQSNQEKRQKGEQKKERKLKLKKYNIRSFYFVALNCNYEYFRNRMVRKALTLATDRWRILTTIYGEKNVNKDDIMSGPYLPEEISPTQEPLPYNLQEAKELLRNAGFPNGFTVELKANIKNEEERQIVDNIVRDLKRIGVRIRVNEMNKYTWKKEVEREKIFQMAFGRYTFHQHTDIVETLFLRNSPLNFCSYSNENVERLIGDIKQSLKTKEKEEKRDKIQKIIREDCPYIFLFRTPLFCGYMSNLHMKVHPYWFFGYINQWYKE
jgi:ABC-type transport system substrate-binding protein